MLKGYYWLRPAIYNGTVGVICSVPGISVYLCGVSKTGVTGTLYQHAANNAYPHQSDQPVLALFTQVRRHTNIPGIMPTATSLPAMRFEGTPEEHVRMNKQTSHEWFPTCCKQIWTPIRP